MGLCIETRDHPDRRMFPDAAQPCQTGSAPRMDRSFGGALTEAGLPLRAGLIHPARMRGPRRSVRFRRVMRWLARGVLALIVPVVASGADRGDEDDRWVPSLSVSLGFLTQQASGAAISGNVLGPPLTTTDELGTGCKVTNSQGQMSRNGGLCPDSEPELVPDTSSSDTSVAPLVGGAFELMTPRPFRSPWAPRFFAHADLSAVFASERNLAGERSPGRLRPPDLNTRQQDAIPEISVLGQGSRAKSQVRRVAVSAGAGLAFTLRLFERTLRLKPSFEYLRQEVELTGELSRAVKQQTPAQGFGTLDDFRKLRLRASDVETQHGVGAGLEIEADTSRLGPFVLSVFAQARGYYFLGDLDYTLSDTNEFGETVTWRYDFDPWAWRGGAGLRFRWLPE